MPSQSQSRLAKTKALLALKVSHSGEIEAGEGRSSAQTQAGGNRNPHLGSQAESSVIRFSQVNSSACFWEIILQYCAE